jgi:hypothetical protein
MTKKDIWLSAILVALVAVYVCFFTSWFKPKVIKILDTQRQTRRFRNKRELPYILFILESGRTKLTEVKVVPETSYQSDHDTPPVWHLISDSNSIPVQQFAYGERIRGMRPAIKGADAQDLQTNVTYLLIVSAGHANGSHDFEIKQSEN